MIPKGNQRGGGRQLATHLLNQFDNDRVEVLELRGAVAKDLHGAFHEWHAQSKATRARKYLYSLSINPDLEKYGLTREQYLDFIARTERSLKLVGQPRAIVFHVKKGREHAHVVWSRIDAEAGKAVQIAHDRMKLRSVVQEFARDHGIPLPETMRENGRKERFDDKKKRADLAEKQQQERSGLPKEERMAIVTQAWNDRKAPSAFVGALEDKGLFLARGDSGRYVVVDLAGEVHSLYRQIEGAKAKEVKDFLAADYPLDRLPDAESARAWAQKQRESREELAKTDLRAKQDEILARQKAARREALKDRQQERRAPLIREHETMQARHAAESEALAELHASENKGILSARAFRQPQGVRAFLMRITGFQMLVGLKHRREDAIRAKDQDRQSEALRSRRARELQDIGRRERALDAIDAREAFSLETRLRREDLQKSLARTAATLTPPLRPEFDKAAAPAEPTGGETSGPLKGVFNRIAEKFSLPQAFNRAADPPAPARTDGDPVDPKLEQARRLRDEVLRRRGARDPDRDRER